MSMYIESFQIKSPQHAICKKVIIHVSEICVWFSLQSKYVLSHEDLLNEAVIYNEASAGCLLAGLYPKKKIQKKIKREKKDSTALSSQGSP